jgi:signal transduction histidine kinase
MQKKKGEPHEKQRDKTKKWQWGMDYRKKQKSTSVYFLLWAIFGVLSFVVVVLFAAMQRVVTTQTYKSEAANEVYRAGSSVQSAVEQPLPSEFEGSWSAYLNFLSARYGVGVYLLTTDGVLVYPRNPEILGDYATGKKDFLAVIQRIQAELAQEQRNYVIYEGDGEFVYGALVAGGEGPLYLYVSEPLQLLKTAIMQMNVRIALMAVFVFVFAFAMSSAVAAWLVRPIIEMKDKAKLLAKGDFGVDFHGSDYGKELVKLADSLNFARDELAKTDAMQKEIIANVSHDFKTPLTMIKAYASMIQEISGDIPEKRNKHAQVIVDEADRLTALVGDILDLSKLRAGLTELKCESVDLSVYTKEILGRFDYLRETQGYEIVEEIESGLRAKVDEIKIGQVLYNLIGNAVNYTGEDKKVFVSLKRVDDQFFRFSVRDTGVGISPENIANIWDRYYRSSEMHKRPVKGTGLGLSVVKAVLERHNLAFGVESEVGVGSTFYVIFPLENA